MKQGALFIIGVVAVTGPLSFGATQITRSVISSGGGAASSSHHTVRATLGQVIVGTATSTHHTIVAGFWIGGGASSITTLTSAVSRKVHGAQGPFDINLPLGPAASAGVECRVAGPTTVVLTFSGPAVGAVAQTSAGTVNSVTVQGNQATLELSGAPNQTCLTLTVSGVVGLQGNPNVPIRCLAGDVTGDGNVNIFDLVPTRNVLNQPTSAANFRSDVTADGSVNIFDLVNIRNGLNLSLTSCP